MGKISEYEDGQDIKFAEQAKQGARLIILALLILLMVVALFMWGCPTYNVWQQGLKGKAELNRAEYNRKIAVQEANAKMESAKLLADAEVIRAEGAAKANQILGSSLTGHENYLRYLWIQGLHSNGNQPTIIYVPTEAGLPILEASRETEPTPAP